MAGELGKLPNNVLVEGHTDARPYSGATSYSNRELSTDRANSARRLMQARGLRAAQVVQVRGFADQILRKQDDPTHASNRRISVIVQYQKPGGSVVVEGTPPVPAPEKTASPLGKSLKKEGH